MFIAIDIGGTKTAIAAYESLDYQSELKALTYPTPPTYSQSLTALLSHISSLTSSRALNAIGISIASGIAQNGKIYDHGNLAAYHDHNLVSDLHQASTQSVFIANDAVCAARAEMLLGYGQNLLSLIHFILGTGFGGAYASRHQNEVRVTPLSPGKTIIQPGGMPHTHYQIKGLFECYLGGKQLEAQVDQPLTSLPDDHLVWCGVANHLALASFNFGQLFAVETITVSGGLISHRPHLIDAAKKVLATYPDALPIPRLYLSTLSNPSLIGALSLCR